MTDKQAKEVTEAMMMTIATFQKGYETILRENKGLEYDRVLQLTDIWWNGVMSMIGLGMQRNDEGDDLW